MSDEEARLSLGRDRRDRIGARVVVRWGLCETAPPG